MLFQVPLGVILKNENKGDEMVDILIHLQQYIPAIEFKTSIVVGTREPYEMTDYVVTKLVQYLIPFLIISFRYFIQSVLYLMLCFYYTYAP